jgi:hypothetical protein
MSEPGGRAREIIYAIWQEVCMYKFILVLVIFCCFISCSSVDEPDTSVIIRLFSKYTECDVIVYADSRRRDEDKVGELRAGNTANALIENIAPGEYTYYLSYRFWISAAPDLALSYIPASGMDTIRVRVDEEAYKEYLMPYDDDDKFRYSRGILGVYIPTVSETLLSPGQLLSNDVYLRIQNDSSFPFQLYYNGAAVRPDGSGSAIVNPREIAVYTIAPGAATAYSLLVNGDNKSIMAGSFAAGRLYSFAYAGAVQLLASAEIKEENIQHPQAGSQAHPHRLREGKWFSSSFNLPADSYNRNWCRFTVSSSSTYFHARFGTAYMEGVVLWIPWSNNINTDRIPIANNFYDASKKEGGSRSTAKLAGYNTPGRTYDFYVSNHDVNSLATTFTIAFSSSETPPPYP